MNASRGRLLLAGVLLAALIALAVSLADDGGAAASDLTAREARPDASVVLPQALEPVQVDEPLDALDAPEALSVPDEQTAPAEAFVFRLLLVDPDDEPAAGVRVTLHHNRGDWQQSEPLHDVLSGADGRVELALDPELPSSGMGLLLRGDGYLTTHTNGSNWTEDEARIQLNWTTTVTGVVRDAEFATPLAGVTVGDNGFVTGSDGRFEVIVAVGRETRIVVDGQLVDRDTGEALAGVALHAGHSTAEPFARTDGAGRFSLRVAPDQERQTVFTLAGYVEVRWHWKADDVGDATTVPMTLSMQGEAYIEGRVIDAAGEPVPQVSVWIDSDADPFGPQPTLALAGVVGEAWDSPPDGHDRSADDGRFRTPVVPHSETYRAVARHEPFVPASSAGLTLDVAGAQAWAELVLHRGGEVHGKVLRNGEPMTWTVIKADSDGGKTAYARADSDGSFRLTGLAPGKVSLVASNQRTGERYDPVTVHVVAGGVLEQDILIREDLGEIAGQVVWSTGEPAAGVAVYATSADAPGQRPSDQVPTADDGRFVLSVPARGVYRVTSWSGARARQDDVAVGTRDVHLELPAQGTLTLQLIDDATGEPVQVESSHGDDRWLSWRPSGDPDWRSARHDGIDVNGRATVPLDAGKIDLFIGLLDEGYATREVFGVFVEQDGNAGAPLAVRLARGHTQELQFVEASSDAALRPDRLIYVVAQEKLGLIREVGPDESSTHTFGGGSGIRLHIADAELAARRLRPDASGRASALGLHPGRYRLVAFPAGLVLTPDTFTIPTTDEQPLVVRFGEPAGGA